MENNKMDFDLYVRTLYKATQYYEKIIELEKQKEIEYLDNGCKNFNILTDFQNEIDELKKISFFNYDHFPTSLFFVPTSKEIEIIELNRLRALEILKKRTLWESDPLTISEMEKDLIDRELVNAYGSLTKNHLSYYQNCALIPYNSSEQRKEILRDFENDNLWFSYIKYLFELKKSISDPSTISEMEKEIPLGLSAKILLLSELGFFELEKVKLLNSDTKRGELVNILLGIQRDETRKYITGLYSEHKNFNPNIHKEEIKKILEDLRKVKKR